MAAAADVPSNPNRNSTSTGKEGQLSVHVVPHLRHKSQHDLESQALMSPN